jgi:hypothetical protein
LTVKLLADYKNGFPNAGEYVGRMDSDFAYKKDK